MLEQIQQGFGDAVNMVITFVPKFLAFLVVLLIGYFVAKMIAKAIDAVLERVGFDRLVERGGVKRALARSRYDASGLLSQIVFYIVMLFVLQLAFGVFGPNPVSLMLVRVVAYLPNVFAAGIIVIVGAAIATAVKDIITAALGGLSYGRALGTAASIAILVVAGFAALDQLNIAPAIVTGLFYAILAVIVGVLVVAVGGAGVQPMRAYWSRALERLEGEAPTIRQTTTSNPGAARQAVEERAGQVKEMAGAGTGARSSGTPRQSY